MAKKPYVVIETITIRKEIPAATDHDDARRQAYSELPDYEAAGWVLADSEGPTITEA